MLIPEQTYSIPDPGSASKNLSILTQIMVTKLYEIWSGLFIPDPGSGTLHPFYPSRITNPNVKKAPGPGSGTLKFVQFYENENRQISQQKSITNAKSIVSMGQSHRLIFLILKNKGVRPTKEPMTNLENNLRYQNINSVTKTSGDQAPLPSYKTYVSCCNYARKNGRPSGLPNI
jgi:hypothetical protein